MTPVGRVHDERRVAFLQEHIAQAGRAIANGVPLHGYFVWSLLDNFEWAIINSRWSSSSQLFITMSFQ